MDGERLIESLRAYLAQQPDVRLAYLFGSQVQGQAHALSDVDVAVLLVEGLSPLAQGQARLRLTTDLIGLLRRDDVDVAVLNRASPLFRHRVLRNGQLLYAADESQRTRFVTDTLQQYLDYSYMYRMLDEAMFARLREGSFGRGQISASGALRKARAMSHEGSGGT
jgi:predicted nucleotidyltransferase